METAELAKLKRFEPNSMEAKLYALEHLAMRFPFIGDLVSDEIVISALSTIASSQSGKYQRRASRIILNLRYGVIKTNDMIEKIAAVTDRNDPLVRRWRLSVLSRDNHRCTRCGSMDNLAVHHKSHWADDPVNRINIDNGETLCVFCHSREHPELDKKLFGGDFCE